jgi:hypothetical protein
MVGIEEARNELDEVFVELDHDIICHDLDVKLLKSLAY